MLTPSVPVLPDRLLLVRHATEPGPALPRRYIGKEKDIPWNEVIVVFDADMCAKPEFFLKILEVLCDDKAALCLTPQVSTGSWPAVQETMPPWCINATCYATPSRWC